MVSLLPEDRAASEFWQQRGFTFFLWLASNSRFVDLHSVSCCTPPPPPSQHSCLPVTLWRASPANESPKTSWSRRKHTSRCNRLRVWNRLALLGDHRWHPAFFFPDCSFLDGSMPTVSAERDFTYPVSSSPCFISTVCLSLCLQDVPNKRGSCGGRGPDWLAVSEVRGERRVAGLLLRQRSVSPCQFAEVKL